VDGDLHIYALFLVSFPNYVMFFFLRLHTVVLLSELVVKRKSLEPYSHYLKNVVAH
jgi:hypothetical protein